MSHTNTALDGLFRWAAEIRSASFLACDEVTPLGPHFAEAGQRAGLGENGYQRLFWSLQDVDVRPALQDVSLPAVLQRKDSIYLVISTKCNSGIAYRDDEGEVQYRACAHCLNGSGPHGTSMTFADVERVVRNLPQELREVEISGGEVLHPDVLPLTLYALRLCSERYGRGLLLSIQTNGDFLRRRRRVHELVSLLREAGLRRLVVASMDIYHGQGATLEERFDERKRHYSRVAENLRGEPVLFVGSEDFGLLPDTPGLLTVHFFGADIQHFFDGFIVDDLAPNARAVRTGLVGEQDNGVQYCARHAGARGFLGSSGDDQVAVNGGPVCPCCWFTEFPLGDARTTPIPQMLLQYVADPLALAQHLGQPHRAQEIARLASPALGDSLRDITASSKGRNQCVACRRLTRRYRDVLLQHGCAQYCHLWQEIPVPWDHRTDPEFDLIAQGDAVFASWA
jgi:hypothetical protein